jgi:hypothetical protein
LTVNFLYLIKSNEYYGAGVVSIVKAQKADMDSKPENITKHDQIIVVVRDM